MRRLFYITLLALNCLAVQAATFPNVFTTNAVGANGVLATTIGTGAYSNSLAFKRANIQANAFADAISVSDPLVRDDLVGFAKELESSGIGTTNTGTTTNLVDALLFNPRFKPASNSLSWAGSTITMSNITFSPWGASFNGNGLIACPITDSRTNTVVIVWRGYTSNYNAAAQQWLGGLINNDPTKYTAQWYYMDNTALKANIRETNTMYAGLGQETLIQPWYVTGYDWTELNGNFDQRRVSATTCNGVGGIYSFWNNGIPAQYGFTNPAVYFTNTAIVPNNALNRILLGVDNLGPSGGFFGGYLKGEIAAVLVFNAPLSTNQMVSVYWALRWLEPGNVNYLFYGDSRYTPAAFSNSIPSYMMQSGALTNLYTWRNASQSGRKLAEFASAANSNAYIYMDAPRGKVTQTRLYNGLGINDVYGNVDSISSMSNNLFTIVSQANTNSVKVYEFTVYPLGTNSTSSYVYSSSTEAHLDGLNDTIVTNANRFAAVIRPETIIGQLELNISSGYSLDTLHMSGSNGFILNRRVANLALGLEQAPNIGPRQILTTLNNTVNGDLGLSGNLTVSGNSTLNNTTSGVLNVSGNIRLLSPTNATTIVNLGLDANGNISSNAVPVGGGTTYPSPVHTNGFSLFAVFSNTVAIDKQHSLVATNLIQAGSPATADNGAYWLYGTNGHLSRLSGVNAEGVDQAGFSWQLDSTIAAYFGTNHFKFLKTITITNTDGLFVTSPTNLFEAFTTNGGFMVYSNDSSLKINGSLQLTGSGTNGIDSLYVTNTLHTGTLVIDNQLASTNISHTFVRTNFISGQLYTNLYGGPIEVLAKATLGVAAVSGNSVLSLEMLGNETNQVGMSTLITSIAMTYTNMLDGIVTNNGTYVFTNKSSGAGNTAAVIGGQIIVY